MSESLASLTTQAEQINLRYQRAFAGRTRATRDLPTLDGIIADAEKLSAALPADAVALKGTLSDWLKLYKSERNAVAEIQGRGPDAVNGWRIVEQAEVLFQRYVRLFAGQRRATRDQWLLQELHDQQAALIAALGPMAKKAKDPKLDDAKGNLEKNLQLYADEIKAIGAARASLNATEHGRVLATIANAQFASYRLHFAEKARLSRRPALLRRINAALGDVAKAMEALRALGNQTEAHLGNIRKVNERIAANERELGLIESSRRQTSARQLAGALGDDANAAFKKYRDEFANKSRQVVDAGALNDLCEVLHEVVRNMLELQSERPDEANQKNISIVLETLKAYEREHRAIVEAQKPKAA